MLEAITKNWWTVLIRGSVAVLFAILLFASPALTLGSIITFFGAFAFVEGLFNTVSSLFSVGKYDAWWVTLLGGIVSIVAGLTVMTWPGLTALTVLWLIAGWAVITGILQIVAAIRLRKDIEGETLMAAGGTLSIIFGVALIAWPTVGITSILWMLALYALIFGITMILLSFKVRSANKSIRAIKTNAINAN